jgi:hypothetical protein
MVLQSPISLQNIKIEIWYLRLEDLNYQCARVFEIPGQSLLGFSVSDRRILFSTRTFRIVSKNLCEENQSLRTF